MVADIFGTGVAGESQEKASISVTQNRFSCRYFKILISMCCTWSWSSQ